MSIPLPTYAKIKDRYCIAYFGNCNEYLVQLRLLRPIMESKFPNVQIYLSCKDESLFILKNESKVVPKSKLQEKDYAYVRQLSCNMRSHPVLDFLKESNISCVLNPLPKTGNHCVIYPSGNAPTKSLNATQIEKAMLYAANKGYSTSINDDFSQAGWVIGVENEQLFEAAGMGIKTSLIPTGIGKNLYKSMFPKGEILEV